MFASPESHNLSGGSADTAVAVDPAWSLQPGSAADGPRPARRAGRPRKFSPEPVRKPGGPSPHWSRESPAGSVAPRHSAVQEARIRAGLGSQHIRRLRPSAQPHVLVHGSKACSLHLQNPHLLQGVTSDDGNSRRGKRRRTSSGGDSHPTSGGDAQRQALSELGIDAAWLPLLQQGPTAAMQVGHVTFVYAL